jgi:hypothetical protein
MVAQVHALVHHRWYVQKHHHPPGPRTARQQRRDPFERAVATVARVTAEVLSDLPPRRQPPKTIPPLRRPEVRARMT